MRNKVWLLWVLCTVFCLLAGTLSSAAFAESGPVPTPVPYPAVDGSFQNGQPAGRGNVNGANGELEMNRVGAVRGGYRSAPGSYSGTRGGLGAGGGSYSTGPRAPSSRVTNPARTAPGTGVGAGYAPSTGRWGSFFGGLAAGAFFSHLLNPFGWFGGGYGGYGYGGGFSFIGLLFWGIILYMVYRVIRSFFFRGPRRWK